MTKIQFKTITQQSFEIEINDSATIAEVKQEIAKTKGEKDFPVEGQKLIYNGKVLEDSKPISEVNVAPGKFIVVMVVKKPVPKTEMQSSSGGEKGTTETKSQTKETSSSEVAESKEVVASTEKKVEVPPEHAKAVQDIEAMGYPHDEVIRALQAAFYNTDRAVEYLCNGIPEGLNLNQGAVVEGGDADEGEEGDVDEMAEGLAFLANSPQFQQLREMVRTDPNTLPQIVQQIAESNPQLMDLIRNNQEQFLALLNSEPTGQAGAAGGPMVQAGVAAQGAAPAGAQRVAIPITQEDREAINRLMGMGFPEPLVIEAYLACDKNENLAVNYILQRMEEFHGGD